MVTQSTKYGLFHDSLNMFYTKQQNNNFTQIFVYTIVLEIIVLYKYSHKLLMCLSEGNHTF
jgi:hypothetical protein